MPYNTRRKSLSLPSLGIQLPQSSRAYVARERATPASASASTSASASASTATPSTPRGDAHAPPSKRVKRSHSLSMSPPPLPGATTTTTTTTNASHRRSSTTTTTTTIKSPTTNSTNRSNATTKNPRRRHVIDHTPPPSPRPSCEPRIDLDGIGDEVVVGVVEQLERTGNKPQLVKELAAVLCNTLDVVESSTNPQAIISSRLNAYLKRSWTALAPCPLAKLLNPTHPRRIYFYLTNQPHQPLPALSSESPLPSSRRAMISPSLSSDDDHEARERAARSPSPEVDLSSGPLDLEMDARPDDGIVGPPTPAGSFGGRSSLGGRDGSHMEGSDVLSTRAASPPLEGDEREFTRTASAMQNKRSFDLQRIDEQARNQTHDANALRVDGEVDMFLSAGSESESEEHAERRHSEAAAVLFGQSPAVPMTMSTSMTAHAGNFMSKHSSNGLHVSTQLTSMTRMVHPLEETASAVTTPMDMDIDTDMDLVVEKRVAFAEQGSEKNKKVSDLAWAMELQSPETVELAELDDLLGGF
ncbi:MAG: hypothetical protein M1823_005550 [Watsoniomyces obsoletus]|nr:MAG: hypothetical protein M1823_005550 [Watsoniomyces obsoletus]